MVDEQDIIKILHKYNLGNNEMAHIISYYDLKKVARDIKSLFEKNE